MKIEMKPIDDLKPFKKNPKKHPKHQLEMLKKSMGEFGWTNPILVAQDNVVIAGHARLEAAKQLDFSEVPTIFIDLPYEKAAAYVIADNRLAELAEQDDNTLAELLQDVAEMPDFDMEAVGFTEDYFNELLQDIEAHNTRFGVGKANISNNVEFIEDEETALAADEEAKAIFAGRKIILVAFSGGKDSTFSLIWAKHNFPDMHIVACFSDTGVEFPGMTAHVWEVCKFFDVECKIVKPSKDVWIYWAEHARFFNVIFPECQSVFVYKPIDEYFVEYDLDDVVIIDGSRGDQARRTSTKTKTSGMKSGRMSKYTYYHPCHDIDHSTEEAIIEKSGVPLWEGYAMGFKRTACWCCPAQASEQAYALSQNYPGLVEVIRRWEKRLGMPLQFTSDKGIDRMIEVGKEKTEKRLAVDT